MAPPVANRPNWPPSWLPRDGCPGSAGLSADRSRIEPVDLEAERAKVEEDTRRRLAGWAAQPPFPGELEGRARQVEIDTAHPL